MATQRTRAETARAERMHRVRELFLEHVSPQLHSPLARSRFERYFEGACALIAEYDQSIFIRPPHDTPISYPPFMDVMLAVVRLKPLSTIELPAQLPVETVHHDLFHSPLVRAAGLRVRAKNKECDRAVEIFDPVLAASVVGDLSNQHIHPRRVGSALEKLMENRHDYPYVLMGYPEAATVDVPGPGASYVLSVKGVNRFDETAYSNSLGCRIETPGEISLLLNAYAWAAALVEEMRASDPVIVGAAYIAESMHYPPKAPGKIWTSDERIISLCTVLRAKRLEDWKVHGFVDTAISSALRIHHS